MEKVFFLSMGKECGVEGLAKMRCNGKFVALTFFFFFFNVGD